MNSRRASSALLFAGLSALAAHCGTSSDGDVGALDGGSDADPAGMFSASDASNLPDSFVACAGQTTEATPLALDLYFMLDKSGSMNDLVGQQQSKWNAVVSAMNAFVADPQSTGIGMGLQYFPLPAAGVPAACTSSAQCGTSGPCALKICNESQSAVVCDSPADCPGGVACVAMGVCQNDANQPCLNPGASCGNDANGFALGTCGSITSAACAAGDSCASQDYATPAVPIALLPGVGAAVTASLAAQHPVNNTPTAAALQGALDEAASYATAHPTHAVIAVLATDGEPDECSPNTAGGIAQLASAALALPTGVKTFAIGVFRPNAIATGTMALDPIAAAGGTGKAFIVDTSQNVAAQFIAALNAIRGAALPCEYEVPAADGGALDFDRVNVKYTPGSGDAVLFPYVETRAACPTSGAAGGWYYDADPSKGGSPTKIEVCPTTCTTLRGDGGRDGGRVDIVLGCQSIIR